MVQYYRKKYDLRLENKNIWIFGAGNTGKRFYDKYREVYKIGGFISNFSTETACLGLPVIRPGEITRQDAPHVVICCNEEALIAEQLGKMGYRGGRDFTFEDMLPKRLLIAVGTCQIERVTKLLQKNIKSVTYDICIYRDNMYAPCSEADNRRLEAYGAYCDVVFYNVVNAGTSEQRNYEPLVTQYFPESKRLFMPFYYFSGQAVQASEVENKYTIMYRNQYFWLRGDKEINNMIENGLTMEEVRRQVANPDYWDREKIRKHFYRELKKIEIMDRFSSFPIKGFIEKNYRDMMIFNDDTHFGFHLSMYLANALAETLDIEPITDPGLLEEAEREERSVMPLYPSVRQALEMNIKGDARIYNVKEGKTVNVDIEMYAEIYYRYVVSIRDIYKGLGTIF